MLDISSDANNSIDGMLGAFFGNISQRAFGRMGGQIDTLENKFKQLGNVAQSRFTSMRAGADKVADAVASINRRLREQAERIRKMPRLPKPTTGQPHPTTGHGRDPSTGRWLPGRGGRGGGGGGGGGRFRFGGTSSGNFYAGGFGGIGGLGTLGAAYGIGSIARGFGAFDADIHTLMAEAGPDINQVGGQAGLTQSILDISGSTQFSSGETAQMLIAMVKDGVKLNDALANIPSVLKLAVAESTDLTTAWNATNTFVSGLNVPLSESVRLMDMMSNATSLSKLQLKDIQYIAGQSLSLYKEIAGFSEEGFLGISGILGPLFRPERIGTGLKQLSLLLPQAARGQLAGSKNDVFSQWGVNITDAGGNLLDEVSVLKEFERVFAGMSGEARNVELAKVFGTEAAPVFSALIGQSAKLAENMQAIRKKGTLDEKFAVHAKSLTNQFKLLTSAGDSLIKKFVMILNEGEAFGGGIGWVTEKITQLTAFMEANKDTIQAWWGNFREIMGGLFNLVGAGIEKVAQFWSGLSEGEKIILTIGGIILTFLANPVAGIIAAGALIVAKWKPIREFFIKLWDKLDAPVMGFIKTVSDGTMRVVNWIRRQWDEMSPYFAKVWDGIGFIATNAWKVIRFVAVKAWEVIKVVWQPVSAFFKALWQGVLLVAEVAWFAIKNTIKGVVLAIEAMWNGLKAVFNWAPVKAIRGGFTALIGFFADLVGKLKAPFQSLLDFVTGIFEKIASGIETVRGWFRRGDEGEHRLVLTVDAEQAQKEVNTAVGAVGTLKLKMDADAPKMKGVSEDMRNLTPEQYLQKQKVDTLLQEALPSAVNQLISNVATTAITGQIKQPTSAKSEFYETRAVTTPAVSGPEKPKARYEDFLKTQAKEASEASRRSKAFGINLKPRAMLGTRAVEDLYKIDDRAMANVRKHFEDVAEKEFLSGLKTYAEQSFSHIDATLTEAQRSMRDKVFATQKMLKEDKERWQKIVDSGALDRFSASVEAAGVAAKHKETYGYLQKALAGASFLSMPEKYQHLQADNIPSVLQPLQGKISPDKLSEVIDLFRNLSKNAAFMPGMQRALKIDSLAIGKGIEAAGLKRGHELLKQVVTTGDTITQAKARLSETDAGLLQSAFDQLKPFAHLLPMMQSLLAREAMLTGEPQGTKMNVFEFPTLTKEQHVALTSVFRSHFLSLIDVNSAQLAVLQQIAGLMGVKNIAGTLGPVIRQQHGTLSDDYLSHRDSQTRKQVLEQSNANIQQVVPPLPLLKKEPAAVGAKDTQKLEIHPVVNVEAIPNPAVNDVTTPVHPSVVRKQEMTAVMPHPNTEPLSVPKDTAIVRESPVLDASYQKSIERVVPPEVLVEKSSEVSVAQPQILLEPMIPPELPIASPQTEEAAPSVPIIRPKFEDAVAPYAPVIQPMKVKHEQPATLKDVELPELQLPAARSQDIGLPDFDLPDPLSHVGDAVAPYAPVIQPMTVKHEQPATLKDVELPELQLPATRSQVEVPSPRIPIEPIGSTELPNVSPHIEDVVVPHAPVIHPQIEEAAAPHVPVIQPQTDTRFENILDYLQPQPPTPPEEKGAATEAQIVKTSEGEKTINNTFNISIEAGDRSAEELYEEIMAIALERGRETNF